MRQRTLIGLGLSSGLAAVAERLRLLTPSGAAAAIGVGTLVFGGEGLGGSAVVLYFFGSSNVLGRLSSERKRRVAADKFDKPAARDAMQVIANGGVGAVAAFAHALHPRRSPWLLAAFVGAFAAATADTWATEVGTLSAATPRSITTGRRVPPGTSGGMTVAGTAASIAGALTTGAVAARTLGQQGDATRRVDLLAAGWMGGLGGALVDSLLGATLQAVRYCPHCNVETEQLIHRCGTATIHRRGLPWLDNDRVNLLSTVAGAGVAMGVAALAGRVGEARRA